MALPDTNVMGYSATQYEAIKHKERFTTEQLEALGMWLVVARMAAIAAAAVARERAARSVREERARADAAAAAAAASTALAAVRPAPLSATAAALTPRRLSKSQKNRLRRAMARASHRAVHVIPAAPHVVVKVVVQANRGG